MYFYECGFSGIRRFLAIALIGRHSVSVKAHDARRQEVQAQSAGEVRKREDAQENFEEERAQKTTEDEAHGKAIEEQAREEAKYQKRTQASADPPKQCEEELARKNAEDEVPATAAEEVGSGQCVLHDVLRMCMLFDAETEETETEDARGEKRFAFEAPCGRQDRTECRRSLLLRRSRDATEQCEIPFFSAIPEPRRTGMLIDDPRNPHRPEATWTWGGKLVNLDCLGADGGVHATTTFLGNGVTGCGGSCYASPTGVYVDNYDYVPPPGFEDGTWLEKQLRIAPAQMPQPCQ